VSLVLVAVVEETRLLPAFGSSYIGAVVYVTWLLPAFWSLVIAAVVEDTRLLSAFVFNDCCSSQGDVAIAGIRVSTL